MTMVLCFKEGGRGREIKRERNQESFREGEHRQNRVRLLRLFKMRTKHEQCEMRGGRERERVGVGGVREMGRESRAERCAGCAEE